jgi:uncharacterized delta-60 repeat protein
MQKLITVFYFVFFLIGGNTFAQPAGTLDPTFNGTGKVVYDRDQMDLYQDVKVQPDGKIIAVGTSYSPTYSSVIEVSRYLENGTFDPLFGTDGHFTLEMNIETGAYKCLILDNGKILIAGYTTDYATYSMLLLQLNPDGTRDLSFGDNGVALVSPGAGENILYALAVQDDGKILAAGYYQNSEYRNVPVILRFSATGILDSTFGTNGLAQVAVTEIDNDFSALCVQSDGKIIAAGHISNGMSWFSLLIARFDQNGNPDTGYGTNGVVNQNLGNVDDEFFDMKLTENDEAILAGFTVSQPDIYYHLLLMKFTYGGQPDATFGTNGVVAAGEVPYSFGDALELQTDGKILVCGSTGQKAPDNNDWAIWRFRPDGGVDDSFGTDGLVTTDFFGNAEEALGLCLYQNKIILCGKTRNADNKLDFAVARYLNDVGVSVPKPAVAPTMGAYPNPACPGEEVNVMFHAIAAGKIKVELLNPMGQSVTVSDHDIPQHGNQNIKLLLPTGLTSGLYCIRISKPDSNTEAIKIIIR